MTESDKSLRFRRKSLVWALGLVLMVVISLSLWYGTKTMERKREGDVIRRQLPALPDTNDWPQAFSQALEEASDAVSGSKDGLAGLGELAMLLHGNAFLKEAETCYTLLNERDSGEARWAYYLADIRLNWGDLASAESLLMTVVALKPTYLPAQLRLGNVLLKSGQSESAHEVNLRCLKLDTDNAYALLGLAREHLRVGEEEEALSTLLRSVEKNPEFAGGYMLMAQLLDRKGEGRKAEIARALGQKYGRYREPPDPWMEAVMTRCYDLDRLMVLADTDVATRRFESALEILDRADNISPEYARAHLIRGFTYSEMGDRAKAIEAYKRALRFDGDSIAIHGELARLYKELGENSAAISMARKGLELSPGSPELLTVLAEILIEEDRQADASVHLRKALQGEPTYLPALRGLARALWEEGNESEAMEAFQEVRRLSPLDSRSRAFLAQHYLKNDDLGKAEAPLREAIDLDPGSPKLREMYVAFLLQSGNRKAREGDYPGAIGDYREALATDPSNVELHFNLGVIYIDMKDYETATESLKIYTTERPEDVRGWIVLGDLAWEQRRYTEAKDYWQESLIVARGMRNSDQIIAAVEERLRRELPDQQAAP